MNTETKTCATCKLDKPLTAFHKGRGYKGGIKSECKRCDNDRLRRWRQDHRPQWKEQWTRANALRRQRQSGISYDPERRAERKMQARNAYLKRKYGITLDDFFRMHDEQRGRCAACGEERPLVVDHCHKTGAIRLLLCDRCNRTIAYAHEDPSYLRRLAIFLDKLNQSVPVVVVDR